MTIALEQAQAALGSYIEGSDYTVDNLALAQVAAQVALAEALAAMTVILREIAQTASAPHTSKAETDSNNPDWLPSWIAGDILRSDAEYAIEAGQSNNYFLWWNGGPNDLRCVGGVNREAEGRWIASVNAPYNPADGSDTRTVGSGDTPKAAIDALWNARNDAYRGG